MTEQPEDIRPRFFNSADDTRLYGCLHMPVGVRRRDTTIVVAPPPGHEYERTHRALRQFAVHASRAGFPVLRFDWRGTGDSAGDVTTSSPEHWPDDLNAAIAHARNAGKAKRMALLGLRLGAALVAKAAGDVDYRVLWHPVSGADMLTEWDRADAEMMRAFEWTQAKDDSILGWKLSSAWRAAYAKIGAAGTEVGAAKMHHLLIGPTAQPDPYSAQAHIVDDGPPLWLQEPMQAIVPFRTITAITAHLDETCA